MMFFLIFNIGTRLGKVGYANTESTIAFLPCEILHLGECLVNPGRRPTLDQLNTLGDRKCCRHGDKEMNVVRNPAYATSPHSVLTRDAAHECPESVPQSPDNDGSAVLSAENVMDV